MSGISLDTPCGKLAVFWPGYSKYGQHILHGQDSLNVDDLNLQGRETLNMDNLNLSCMDRYSDMDKFSLMGS